MAICYQNRKKPTLVLCSTCIQIIVLLLFIIRNKNVKCDKYCGFILQCRRQTTFYNHVTTSSSFTYHKTYKTVKPQSSTTILYTTPTNNDKPPPTTPPQAQATTTTSDELFQKRSKHWIIIVDDEESLRMSLGTYLYNAGYSVTACSDAEALLEILSSISYGNYNNDNNNSGGRDDNNGSTALSFYDDRFPNAIICDIRMPGEGMDGLDLLTLLKNPSFFSSNNNNNIKHEINEKQSNDVIALLSSSSTKSSAASAEATTTAASNNIFQSNKDWDFIRQQWKRIPVVLLTAKSLTQDRIEGYRRGADVYLPKPFNPEELLSIIDNVIERTNVLTGRSTSNGNENIQQRTPTLRDLKGDLVEIKSLLREQQELQKRARRLLRAQPPSSSTSNNSSSRNNDDSNKIRTGNKLVPSTSALVPLSKTQRSGITSIDGKIIPQSEIDDFNARIKLSPAEKKILNLMSQGYTNGEISEIIGSVSTARVSRTISNMYIKTFTKTRTELVKWGLKMGHIDT